MTEQTPDRQSSVNVQIFGAEYSIRSQSDSEDVQQVAEMVDSAMRKVSTRRVMKSATEVAVLASMNLAGELLRAKRRLESVLSRVDESTGALATVLNEESAS